jgi:hypothetical protein
VLFVRHPRQMAVFYIDGRTVDDLAPRAGGGAGRVWCVAGVVDYRRD